MRRGESGREPLQARLFKAALIAAITLVVFGQGSAYAIAAPDAADEASEPSAAAPESESASAAAQAPVRKGPNSPDKALDGRVKLLAKELKLSPTQQKQVRKVLVSQREQVTALWNDTSLAPALRVSRTQAIGDRTADQIRALLTDAQREKYIKPRVRETSVGNGGANVEQWTKPAKGK